MIHLRDEFDNFFQSFAFTLGLTCVEVFFVLPSRKNLFVGHVSTSFCSNPLQTNQYYCVRTSQWVCWCALGFGSSKQFSLLVTFLLKSCISATSRENCFEEPNPRAHQHTHCEVRTQDHCQHKRRSDPLIRVDDMFFKSNYSRLRGN